MYAFKRAKRARGANNNNWGYCVTCAHHHATFQGNNSCDALSLCVFHLFSLKNVGGMSFFLRFTSAPYFYVPTKRIFWGGNAPCSKIIRRRQWNLYQDLKSVSRHKKRQSLFHKFCLEFVHAEIFIRENYATSVYLKNWLRTERRVNNLRNILFREMNFNGYLSRSLIATKNISLTRHENDCAQFFHNCTFSTALSFLFDHYKKSIILTWSPYCSQRKSLTYNFAMQTLFSHVHFCTAF